MPLTGHPAHHRLCTSASLHGARTRISVRVIVKYAPLLLSLSAQDFEQASEHFHAASAASSAISHCNLAMMYMHGLGTWGLGERICILYALGHRLLAFIMYRLCVGSTTVTVKYTMFSHSLLFFKSVLCSLCLQT